MSKSPATKYVRFIVRIVAVFCLLAGLAFAQKQLNIPPEAQAGPGFNAVTATNAYLETVPKADRERTDAYFEGGYWLILWDALVGLAVGLLLLETGISARMRDLAERITRSGFLRIFLYWVQYLLAVYVLSFPMDAWEGYFRELKYGLSNQTFVGWLSDDLIGLVLNLVGGGLTVCLIFLVVRKLPKTWPVWGAITMFLVMVFTVVITPVFISPMFNTYTLLKDPVMRDPILRMARASGIPAKDVWQTNTSKQSKRVTANVSGVGGTMRITMSDNLLERASPPAVLAVLGHEMGHYVLNHVYKTLLYSLIVIVMTFALLRWSVGRLLRWRGAKWGIRGESDVAVIPLAVMVMIVAGTLYTPIQNTWIRTAEYEADIFGLNAARQPDGFAEDAILLGEYRKLDPTPLEEFLFFDHPSGRTRIYSAMRWKAENQ